MHGGGTETVHELWLEKIDSLSRKRETGSFQPFQNGTLGCFVLKFNYIYLKINNKKGWKTPEKETQRKPENNSFLLRVWWCFVFISSEVLLDAKWNVFFLSVRKAKVLLQNSVLLQNNQNWVWIFSVWPPNWSIIPSTLLATLNSGWNLLLSNSLADYGFSLVAPLGRQYWPVVGTVDWASGLLGSTLSFDAHSLATLGKSFTLPMLLAPKLYWE